MKSLAIGDDRSAILIIQQSQPDPQKALAELIENGIDARASQIRITRRKREGAVEIVVEDNGEGVKAGPDGCPDFDRIAHGICDSYKKYLDADARQGIQGEYAIGILGFAAIGAELEMISRTAASPTRGLRLRAGSVEYETFAPKHSLAAAGSVITVRQVRKEIQSRLTADKLSRYLGSELRDRIRSARVEIRIEDKLPGGRSLTVQPRRFEGRKIPGLGDILVGGGRVKFELYVAGEGTEARVAVVRRGTRVLDDMGDIEELAHEPWNTGRLEGLVHFDLLTPAPASRKGIVPDESLRRFIDTVSRVEPAVRAFLEGIEKEKDEELGRTLVREVQEVFASVVNELAADYNWFDGQKGGPLPGTRSGGGTRRQEVRLSRGPLASVEIVPRLAQISPGESKRFSARALDPHGALIPVDVVYAWRHSSPLASLAAEGPEATLQAGDTEGEGRLGVMAQQGSTVVEAEAGFLILKVKKVTGGRRLPFLEPIHRPDEEWRSRWVQSRGVIEYNTGHANYIQARQRGKRGLLRYVALLVAKELVLHNFAGKQSPLLLERMVEVVSALHQKI